MLAATLTLVQLWLRPLLCGVNSRGAIIAGNHLHTLLHSERRAKPFFSGLASRPPDWPACGDVDTHSSVSQKDATRSAGGDPITWAAIGSEGKCRQRLAHTSVPRRRTDACFPQLTLLPVHTYTLTCRAQAYLCTCSLNLKVSAGPRCVEFCVSVCVCVLGVSQLYLNVTYQCMCSSEEVKTKLTKKISCRLARRGTAGKHFPCTLLSGPHILVYKAENFQKYLFGLGVSSAN